MTVWILKASHYYSYINLLNIPTNIFTVLYLIIYFQRVELQRLRSESLYNWIVPYLLFQIPFNNKYIERVRKIRKGWCYGCKCRYVALRIQKVYNIGALGQISGNTLPELSRETISCTVIRSYLLNRIFLERHEGGKQNRSAITTPDTNVTTFHA